MTEIDFKVSKNAEILQQYLLQKSAIMDKLKGTYLLPYLLTSQYLVGKLNDVVITDDPINAQKFMPWAIIVGSAVMKEKDLLQGSIGWYKYPGGPIGIDYSILNNAKYAIISASTFSFWPCWTNTQFKTIIAPKYWTDFKISNGWWRGDDNIVDEWLYLDMKGNTMIGSDCRAEYNKYRSQNSFYSNLK
jgi:hypothetical protein